MNRHKKYKLKNKEKIKAHAVALYLHPKSEPCSIKGCLNKAERHHENYDEPEKIIWLCRHHHLMVHGKLRGKCSLCDNPHHAKGYCKGHYAISFRKEQGW